MFFTQYFSHLSSKNSNYHLYTFKSVAIIITTLAFAGCSSSHSVVKRSAKLSTGIQKAYSVAPDTANRVSPMIIQSAEKHGLDPLLVASVIRQESTYRSQASSPAGAVGLMQVIPRYWQSTCGGNLYDEASNIQCGAYILSHYHQSSGDIKKALGYYNVGPTNYEKNRNMRKQGKKYATQVLTHHKQLKSSM